MNLRRAVLGTVFLLIAAGWLQAEPGVVSRTPLVLESVGVMFVGGRETPMRGGRGAGGEASQYVGQAPVHFLLPPADATGDGKPVVMIPGMGLTSSIYLGTPDGREGWASLFARRGYPVYVFDEPGNAISGFDIGALASGAGETEPSGKLRLWSNEIVWRRWGIGPEVGVPFDDTQFPFESIGQLQRSLTPVLSDGRGGRGSARPSEDKLDALAELLEKVGPATLLVHSASGPLGFETARRRPDLVAGIVAVEATGYPSDPEDIAANFATKPFVAVFGDHFETRPMAGRYDAAAHTVLSIVAEGGDAELIHMPSRGVRGNTHVLMQDRNNSGIARLIMETLERE